MRALLLAVLLACNETGLAADAGENPCLSLFPALRVETTCAGELRVVIGNRDVPPTPRRVDLAGAILIPWPEWAADGVPSFIEIGGAHVDFAAHPYLCQAVAVSCAP
jgi:hypothetical protein